MKIKHKCRYAFEHFLLSRNLLLEKSVNFKLIKNFIKRFRENYVSVDLIRIGSKGDGGYLVPDDIEGIQHCFSPGVDSTADFEGDLSKIYGIKSFMADASVSAPPFHDSNFDFEAKFLGSSDAREYTTLSTWLEDKVDHDDNDLLLQMNIEGAEYGILTETDTSTLKRFRIVVIEFHSLYKLFDENFLSSISAIFEKFYKNFFIAHVHPNNHERIISYGDVAVPNVIEVTFIRKDRVDACASNAPIILPHAFDIANKTRKKDIKMPKAWWSK